MTTINRFRIRGFCGALAVALNLGLAQPACADGQPQRQWARQWGTSGDDEGGRVATDKQGNVYVAGWTQGSLAGANRGGYDAWVKKNSTAGIQLWQRQPGTSGNDFAHSVTTDGAGNVFIAGSTEGSLAGTNRGGYDAWVMKFSPAGVLLWKRQLGTADDDIAGNAATDGAGNVYLAGLTLGSLAANNHGEADAWIAKYSAAGALLWKRQLGTAEDDGASGLATDPVGNVYIVGQTFGPLAGTHRGETDAWIVKYSATGAVLWKRQLGTETPEQGRAVATDKQGNVYFVGNVGQCCGAIDAWIVKYSAGGTLLWKRQFGTPTFDDPHGVTTDDKGNVYIVGQTEGSLAGANKGSTDAWIVKYSPAGTVLWKQQIGTPDFDLAGDVATDDTGGIYIGGHTAGSLAGPYRGIVDAWIVKFFLDP